MTKLLAGVAAVAILVIAVIAAVVIALLPATDEAPSAAPVAGNQAPPQVFTMRGAVILERPWVSAKSGDAPFSCMGAESYAEFQQGAQVVITTAAGNTIGLGSLGAGWRDERGCVFQFEVANVPAGEAFYGVEVSGSGRRQYTASQVASHFELRIDVP